MISQFNSNYIGTIVTVAGNGTAGYSGDGGLATQAILNHPTGIVVAPNGDFYFTDQGNNVVRMVVAATGKISTITGNGTQGYTGNNGLAVKAEFSYPIGIAMDSLGDVYIADQIRTASFERSTPPNTSPPSSAPSAVQAVITDRPLKRN